MVAEKDKSKQEQQVVAPAKVKLKVLIPFGNDEESYIGGQIIEAEELYAKSWIEHSLAEKVK